MAVRVLTDSTADLPPELVARHRITVIPLLVQFGAESFRDGVDLTAAAFFGRLRSSQVLPTTSQPAVATFQAAYAELIRDGSPVVAIHISATLSGTYQSSRLAAESFPAASIAVIDSRTVSMGIGWLASEAARAAEAGASLDDVVSLVQRLQQRVRLMAAFETLEFLHRGGRIGRARAFLGALLDVKPIIELREGQVVPLERVRTQRRALERLAELTLGLGKVTHLAIVHGAVPDRAERLRERLAGELPAAEVLVCEIGPVLGTHLGPGVVAVAALVDGD